MEKNYLIFLIDFAAFLQVSAHVSDWGDFYAEAKQEGKEEGAAPHVTTGSRYMTADLWKKKRFPVRKEGL